jgi:hypothetical protein
MTRSSQAGTALASKAKAAVDISVVPRKNLPPKHFVHHRDD